MPSCESNDDVFEFAIGAVARVVDQRAEREAAVFDLGVELGGAVAAFPGRQRIT